VWYNLSAATWYGLQSESQIDGRSDSLKAVVRESAAERQSVRGDAAETARTGKVLIARELVRISHRAAELTGIAAGEATTRWTADHGLAEKGPRVEAVTITPLGVRAPVVESDAMLVVRITLARLRTVPTSKSETLTIDPSELPLPFDVGSSDPEFLQLPKPAADSPLRRLVGDDGQLSALHLANLPRALPVGLFGVEGVSRSADGGRLLGDGSTDWRIGSVRIAGNAAGGGRATLGTIPNLADLERRLILRRLLGVFIVACIRRVGRRRGSRNIVVRSGITIPSLHSGRNFVFHDQISRRRALSRIFLWTSLDFVFPFTMTPRNFVPFANFCFSSRLDIFRIRLIRKEGAIRRDIEAAFPLGKTEEHACGAANVRSVKSVGRTDDESCRILRIASKADQSGRVQRSRFIRSHFPVADIGRLGSRDILDRAGALGHHRPDARLQLEIEGEPLDAGQRDALLVLALKIAAKMFTVTVKRLIVNVLPRTNIAINSRHQQEGGHEIPRHLIDKIPPI